MLDREARKELEKLTDRIQEICDKHEIPLKDQSNMAAIVCEMQMVYYRFGMVTGLQMARQVLKEELENYDNENNSTNFVI